MFEFDVYERDLHVEGPTRPAEPYEPAGDVDALSFLFWGEHCIECADPDCYTSCDLYQARPDGRCRRFEYGIHKNRRYRSLRGYGAEVAFKTWGKIEASGNTHMEPVHRVLERERRMSRSGAVLRAAEPAASALAGESGRAAPNPGRTARRLHRRSGGEIKPDAFLMEVYNPMAEAVSVQLVMRAEPPERRGIEAAGPPPPPFVAKVPLNPGYFRHAFPRAAFAAVPESGLPFKVSVIPEPDKRVRLVFLTLDFVAAVRAGAATDRRPGAKCVVFDLDDTLWQGVLVERDDVRLRPGVVDTIRELDRRGILIAVASKNDRDRAWAKLEALGLADYVVAAEINWGPKSAGIRAIAEALNIGLDTFAFVDDNPFERAEVSRVHADVTCLDPADMASVLNDPRFRGSGSGEAGQRRRYYRDAAVRNDAQTTWGDDYLGFLTACKIRLEISPFAPKDFDRVSELLQRTNQLNFSGTKYSRQDLEALVADDALEKHVLRCEDSYGSYGTIGFALVRRAGAAIRVEDFMLSCRVQGRFIEQAFFHHLLTAVDAAGPAVLRVRLRPTARNGPARDVLASLGFRADESGQALVWRGDSGDLACGVVTVAAADPGSRPEAGSTASAGQ